MGKDTEIYTRSTIPIASPSQEATCLAIIKEWAKKQPHLPENISDNDFLQYLHCSHYSVEKTKNVIDAYYTLRSTVEFFLNRNLDSREFQLYRNAMYYFQFDKTTAKGEKIIFYRLSNFDPEAFDYVSNARYCLAALDTFLEENGRQPGYQAVFDLEGFALGHLVKLTGHLSLVKKEMEYVQEALPFRLTGIHIINTTPVVDSIMTLFKPMINSELLNMIHFYKKDELHRLFPLIPKEIFPEEYGGNEPSIKEQTDKAMAKLIKARKLVEFKETQKVNEKLRITPSKHSDSSLGLQGSFKKLDLD